MLCTIAIILLASVLGSVPPATGDGEVHIPNVAPTVIAASIYDDTHTTDVNNTMIDPASGGAVEEYEVTATIGDDNTLSDVKNVTVYLYDPGNGYTNGTYDQVGSYGFAWVNATGSISWKELTAGGWSGTLGQLDSPHCSYPDLTGSSGDWVFEFAMSKVSRRTATADGWKVQVWVYDEDEARASNQVLQFGINFYYEVMTVNAVTWTSVTLGGANQTADLNPYEFTVTANAPFKIQIKSLVSQLTGTLGQTPFAVSNIAIDNDAVVGDAKIAHLSTSWQDFESNAAGSNVSKNSYWFITIPTVVRDDTYTFGFASQVVINE